MHNSALMLSAFIPLAFRIILAGVFLLAGATKLVDPRGTRRALRDFGLSTALARPMMLLLPLAEIAAGAMLLFVGAAWYGAAGALGLLVIFFIAMIVAMIRGRKPDCHCFGQLHSAPVGRTAIIRDVVLGTLAAWLVYSGPAHTGPDVWAWLGSLEGLEFKAAIGGICLVVLLFVGAVARSRPRHAEPEIKTENVEEEEIETESVEREKVENEDRETAEKEPPERLEAVAVVTESKPPAPPPAKPRKPVRNPMGIGLSIGAPAPDFELPAVSGERRSLKALRSGGIDTLLIFSSPYCHSCEALAPNLIRWSRELQAMPNVVIVSRGTPKENLAKLKDFSPSWVLLQREAEVSEAYDVNATPSAVIVSSDGRIRSELVTGPVEIKKLLEANAKRKSPA